ncbi:MAG TPA: hypothetical protein VJ783_19700 [Pirellulales bacterium]|nr:hypothetical protein [Pirellulales bacterium]
MPIRSCKIWGRRGKPLLQSPWLPRPKPKKDAVEAEMKAFKEKLEMFIKLQEWINQQLEKEQQFKPPAPPVPPFLPAPGGGFYV